VYWVGKPHQLAAAVLADRADQVEGRDFLGEMKANGIDKFIRSVDGCRSSHRPDAARQQAERGGEMHVDMREALAAHPVGEYHCFGEVEEVG
jgi:hypothetical protein